MLFNSIAFFVFLGIVLPAYYVLSRRAQNVLLLVGSYVFYGWWDWRFLSLLAISTVVDYFCGKGIAAADRPATRKRYLIASLLTNLGILGFFKYCGFFVASLASLLAELGIPASLPVLSIVLPVGISFYTFQTLSYTIDIYRGKLEPTNHFIDFALFVAYFPQLVAGPIERATNLLPQIGRDRKVAWPEIGRGFELILIGFFKKVAVADAIAGLIDMRFGNIELCSGPDLLLASYFFGLQIYCDFSGYSDIARGVSKLFGIDLMRNFNQPYLSQSITEFWRRWHISLSTWLRDYLYIPLGGNRMGRFFTYRNLMLTMLLGGLWHGAGWNFVIWGGLHGTYLLTHKLMLARRGLNAPVVGPLVSASGILKVVVTFHLVTLTWIFFRCDTFTDAINCLQAILTMAPGTDTFSATDWLSRRIWILVVPLILCDFVQYRTGKHAIMLSWPWLIRGLMYGILAALILILGGIDEAVPFIYFQF